MRAYQVNFFKKLVSSDGHAFKCPQQAITVDAQSMEIALDAAKRQFERRRSIPDWRLHADAAEVTEDPAVTQPAAAD
jgi:hypothetical protein